MSRSKRFRTIVFPHLFPITPSALANLVAALSNMKKTYYLFTLMAGKLVMIFTVSDIGYDLMALVSQLLRAVIVVLVIFLLWIVGKAYETRLKCKSGSGFSFGRNET